MIVVGVYLNNRLVQDVECKQHSMPRADPGTEWLFV